MKFFINNAFLAITGMIAVLSAVQPTFGEIEYSRIDGNFYAFEVTKDANGNDSVVEAMFDYDQTGETYYAGIVTIPDSVSYKGYTLPVCRLYTPMLFSFNNNIDELHIGKHINDINYRNFDCSFSSLTKVTFAADTLTITYNPFNSCGGLQQMVFDSKLTRLHDAALFMTCAKKIVFKGDSHLTGTGRYDKYAYWSPEIEWCDGVHVLGAQAFANYERDELELSGRCRIDSAAFTEDAMNATLIKKLILDQRLAGDATSLDADGYAIGEYALGHIDRTGYLQTIVCKDPTPWPIHPRAFVTPAHWDVMSAVVPDEVWVPENEDFLKTLTLRVPKEAVTTYQNHPVWGRAANIVGDDAAVDSITADSTGSRPDEYFNLQGVKVDPAAAGPGIYIRRQGNKIEKVRL